MAAPYQQQQQQQPPAAPFAFEEEYVAIQTVKESLEESWSYFHSGKLPIGTDPSLPAPTVEQTHELLDVYYQLLQTVQEASNAEQRAFVVDASIQLHSANDNNTINQNSYTNNSNNNGSYYNLNTSSASAPSSYGVLPVLANFAIHTMSYAPEVLDNGGSLQEAFGGLRCHALRCLKAIILLAAAAEDDAAAAAANNTINQTTNNNTTNNNHSAAIGANNSNNGGIIAAGLGCASRCTAALIELSLPEDIMVTIIPATGLHESIRVAACEVIFAFAFRLPSACQSLIVCQAVPRLLLRLRAEPMPTVKVFICSILRLLVTEMPSEAIGDGLSDFAMPTNNTINHQNTNNNNASSAASVVSAFVDILLSDQELDDVRVMATEVLCSACKTRVGAKQLLATDNALLSDILILAQFTISNAEAAPSVVEALCRLLECMTIAASSLRVVPFFEMMVSMGMEKPLAQNLRRPKTEVHICAAAARALRHLVQWSPPAYNLGTSIVTNFPTLSVILKTTLECEKESVDLSTNDADLHHQIVSVELAITIALMMAQSPFGRAHINSELSQYPAWSTSLLDAVAKFLNAPTLDYYASIDVIDVTGVCINSLGAVQWSEAGKPLKSSIRRLFEEQRDRVERGQVGPSFDHSNTNNNNSAGPFFSPSPARGGAAAAASSSHNGPAAGPDEIKARAKLTFVLLNFAMALALDPASGDGGVTEGGNQSVGTAANGLGMIGGATPSRISRGGGGGGGANDSHILATTPRGGAGGVGGASARTFPSMGRNAAMAGGAIPVRPALSRAEKEHLMYAYDKFDSAFKLVLAFSKYYEKKDRQEATYLPTADGYMVRQTQLKNPWAKIVKRKRALSWSVADVKEGDLFYFAVPYEELTLKAVESLLLMLRKHMTQTKKSLVITPHAAKGRRSLLYDLQENVLPQTLNLLLRLADLLDTQGESTVRFPIFLFREREIHIGERCLHSGILANVMDQVEYYFMQTAEEQSAMQHRPDLTADIDAKIAELRARTFNGTEEAVDGPDSDDDERVPGRGHGGISSDSD